MVTAADDHFATAFKRLLASGVSASPNLNSPTLSDSTGVQAPSVSVLASPSTMPGSLTTMNKKSSEHGRSEDKEYLSLPERNRGNLRPSARTAYAKRINTDGLVICDESKFTSCTLKVIEQEKGQDLFPLHGICFQLRPDPAHPDEKVSTNIEACLPKEAKLSSSNTSRNKSRKILSSSDDVQLPTLLKDQEQIMKSVSDGRTSRFVVQSR
jgi:hypothetical protein